MKKMLLSFLVIICIAPVFSATYYYSRGNLNVNDLDSWRTQRNGSGTAPTSFTLDDLVFIVQNTHSMTASAQWVVNGDNSWVGVESGGKITTGTFNHQITGTVYNGGTYEVTHTTYSNLGWGGNGLLETNSNFVLNNASINFNDRVSYGNLIVKAGTAECRGTTTGFEVKGTLWLQGGFFDGALAEDQVYNMGGIRIDSGIFYGSTGSASVTYNISGNVTVGGGYFLGSEGSGSCTYNIAGDLSMSNGYFYGCYEDNGNNPNNVYNIGGSFTRTGGYYYAVLITGEGYPTYYLRGSGKNLGLGNVSYDYECQHDIEITSGASYTLVNHIPFGSFRRFDIRGLLNAESYQIKALAANTIFTVYGTLKTANANGLSGSSSSTFASTNNPTVQLWSGTECTVEYHSSSAQAISPRTDYRNLITSGAGAKTISGTTTAATSLSVGAPLVISGTTTSSGSLVVNATITISSGQTLYINGSMSGTASITGDNVVIGGTGSQLNLGSLNVEDLTLNRANGAQMAADVHTVNLVLTQGNFSIATHTLTLDGSLSGSGTLAGGTGSNLNVGGTASTLILPSGFVLNSLVINRPNGCSMGGNLSVTNLSMSGGSLGVGNYNLSLYGTMSWGSGALNTNASSTIVLSGSSGTGNVYPISTGNITVACSGRTCNFGGNTHLGNLTLSSGILAVGNNTLYISGNINANGASLTGGANANLQIEASASSVAIPPITLNTFTQLNSLVSLTGSMLVNNPQLQTGILNIGAYTLTIQHAPGTPDIKGSGQISGTSGSSLQLALTGDNVYSPPPFNVGIFGVNSEGRVQINALSAVSSQLSLGQGVLDPQGLLSLNLGASIIRINGSLLSAPVFSGNHTLFYMGSCAAGDELPLGEGMLRGMHLMMPAMVLTVTGKDIRTGMIRMLADTSILLDETSSITLEPGAMIDAGINATIFGAVVQDVGDQGFSASALGLSVGAGTMIEGFGCVHRPQSQNYGGNAGILRTWTLEGSFSGSVELTLSWSSNADNGIEFSPQNRAILYCRVGGIWQQVGEPIDVSGSDPRSITCSTSHFSEWTVGSEESTLPVELSSFTAVATNSGSVCVHWITQSETNLLGYMIYRSDLAEFSQAMQITNLISATNTPSMHAYSFTDEENLHQHTYYYWLQSMEMNGATQLFGYIAVDIADPDDPGAPVVELPVLTMYPNPFCHDLNIRLYQKEQAPVSLCIYDVKGRLLCKPCTGVLDKGTHEFIWQGSDHQGRELSSGIYILVYNSGARRETRKITLVK